MQRGHYRVVQALLKKGANPDKPSPDGKTPLALAVRVRAVRSFIMSAVNGSPTMGFMQYAEADINGLLPENSANVDNPIDHGYTPLAVAAEVRPDEALPCGDANHLLTRLLTGVMQGGHADIVKMLLGKGANANNPMPDGETPLTIAARVSASGGITVSIIDASPTTLFPDVMQMGMLRLSGCCLKSRRLQMLTSRHRTDTHPWLWMQE